MDKRKLSKLATFSDGWGNFFDSRCRLIFCAASELLILNADEIALEVVVAGALGLQVAENPSQAAVHAVLCLRARFHYRMQNQIK